MFKKIFAQVLYLILAITAGAQTENYTIRKTPFSSDKYDEFSPVKYRGGIVFCSNRNSGLLFNYSTSGNKKLFKIFYSGASGKDEAVLLSQSLSTQFNDGPVSFNKTGDTVYFSRNINTGTNPLNASDPRNKLGIFFAVREGSKWKNITELRFNSDSYNVTTPWLSNDGRKLYFASDKPGGFGGSDLYVCEWKNNYWNNPVNLGKNINTKGNEAYPFVNESGELFFSSDGHPGLGKKDIFFSKYVDTAWIEPVRLNPPINSKQDDFGFITDNDLNEGYFSSARGSTVDIYSFTTIVPQFLYCSEQKEPRLCFRFEDDMAIDIDPLSLQFVWDFGDGKTAEGYVVDHCYGKPGKYKVRQNIVERNTGTLVFGKMYYELDLERNSGARIISNDFTIPGTETLLEGEIAAMQGLEIISYHWDFGDGASGSGRSVRHKFNNNGPYDVKLGIVARDLSAGTNKKFCVLKKINVTGEAMGKPGINPSDDQIEIYPEVRGSGDVQVNIFYSAADELAEKAIFQVEVLKSESRIKPDDAVFSKLYPFYAVREIFNEAEKLYSYVIDEGLKFMDIYPSVKAAAKAGFVNVSVKTFVPDDPAERDLWNIKRQYDMSADLFFERDGTRLKPGEYTILEQIAVFLKKNPDVVLEISNHTDNTGQAEASIKLSQARSESIVLYLVTRGINEERLKPVGYGNIRPVAPDYSEAERKKNRRIDFLMLR